MGKRANENSMEWDGATWNEKVNSILTRRENETELNRTEEQQQHSKIYGTPKKHTYTHTNKKKERNQKKHMEDLCSFAGFLPLSRYSVSIVCLCVDTQSHEIFDWIFLGSHIITKHSIYV